MKTLTITDLARTEQLDRSAMAHVRGGFKMGTPGYSYGDLNYAPSVDSSISSGLGGRPDSSAMGKQRRAPTSSVSPISEAHTPGVGCGKVV